MARFASPYASRLYNYIDSQPDSVTPKNNCHERAHMSIDDFGRGLHWLTHFGYVREVTEHGRVMLEIVR